MTRVKQARKGMAFEKNIEKYGNKKYRDFTRRSSESTSIKEALNSMLKKYRLQGKFREMQLIHSWEKIMGKPIAARTSGLYVKDRILFVKLTSAPLKKELSMGKTKIIELFENQVGSGIITNIHFL